MALFEVMLYSLHVSLKMMQTKILHRIVTSQRLALNSFRPSSSSNLDLDKLEAESSAAIEVLDDEIAKREQEIEAKRNKSRLRYGHRNLLMEKNPYSEPQYWTHGTLKYNRRLFGRYGFESGVNPAICWPTNEELADAKEYERVAFPSTVQAMIETAQRNRREKEERELERQKEIVDRVSKLNGWIKEMRDRVAKKEKEAYAAKAKRERLIEEVRAHFGYTVDPKDDRFKEMLEKKEKEQKKAAKEERRKIKEKELMDKLLKKSSKRQTEGAASEVEKQ